MLCYALGIYWSQIVMDMSVPVCGEKDHYLVLSHFVRWAEHLGWHMRWINSACLKTRAEANSRTMAMLTYICYLRCLIFFRIIWFLVGNRVYTLQLKTEDTRDTEPVELNRIWALVWGFYRVFFFFFYHHWELYSVPFGNLCTQLHQRKVSVE